MLIRRILYWSNYTVVRWQLLLFAAAFAIVMITLNNKYSVMDYPRWPVMVLFFKIAGYAMAAIVGGSIISAILAWAFFMYQFGKKKNTVKISFGNEGEAEAGWVPVHLSIRGSYRPFLGMIRARLVFSNLKLSESFAIDENSYEKGSLIRSGIRGTGKVMLHDRGIYDLEEVQISFCDPLRFISLPVTIEASQQLFTLPQVQAVREVKANPNATEEQTHRIEIPKRVEGEFLNYKDFESGDDVRRIVWKIYARSGQLVVRIPETMDPYASQLYFYVSFYKQSDSAADVFESELLNSYKDRARNLFEALEKNGFEMRLPHDQETPKLSGMGDKKNEIFHIAAASWQNDLPPSLFVESRKAAFVCLSSFVPASEIERMLGNLPQNVPVVAVRMSEGIASPFRFKVKHIFFSPEPEPADKLRRPWLISPLRSQLKKNERDIQLLFQRRGNAWLIGPEEIV